MKIRAINKIYGKLKMKFFEMPNASYTNRYAITAFDVLPIIELLHSVQMEASRSTIEFIPH